MSHHIDYYFATISPWAFLGHDRSRRWRAARATVAVKPVNFGEVFPCVGRPAAIEARAAATGVSAGGARSLVEISRHPAQHPSEILSGQRRPGGRLDPRRGESDQAKALALAGAIGRALWCEERDIADEATLRTLAEGLGLEAGALSARAPQMSARYAELTKEAIDRGVFGAPSYVIDGEIFWGQDRMDFVARKLAK
jgi:2-hydroxychromene-2-carboxylate isomerase